MVSHPRDPVAQPTDTHPTAEEDSSPGSGTSRTQLPVKGASLFRWRQLPIALRRAILLILLVAAWQAYVVISGVSSLQVASPYETGETLYNGLLNGTLATATVTTLRLLAIGMAIGMALAAIMTALALVSQVGDDLLGVLTSVINPLPSIAILPLAILWFGLTPQALVLVLANAVVWPLAINLSSGFRTVSPTLLSIGRNIGLSRIRQITEVLLPAALPYIFAGFKTAWAFGWRTMVAAELVFGVAGGKGGLGYFINEARYSLNIPGVFAGLVTIAVLGVLMESFFTLLERHTVVRWGMKAD